MKTIDKTILKAFRAEFERVSSTMNGSTNSPAHLLRKSALQSVLSDGLPSRKQEEYKYTPLSSMLEKAFDSADSATNPGVVTSDDLLVLNGIKIVFVNGFYNEALSSITEVDGLAISAVTSQKGLLDEVDDEISGDHYANLNLALAHSGVKISVAKNKVIETPIYLINYIDTKAGKSMAALRHRIEIGENAQATVCEVFQDKGSDVSFSNTATQVVVGPRAVLNYYKLGLDGENALRVDNTECHQQQNSVFNTMNVNFGGKLIRNNLTIILDGEYCESNLDGLYIPLNGGLVDNHTVVDHRLPNSNSNELYKGIMTDNSTGVFNGKVFVRQDAQKTNAFQSNKNILMADTATINTKPQLEIWADDVKCSHGCTTGQLDKEQLFYLRARGIDEPSARKLLLKAFAEEVIDKIKLQELKELAEKHLEQKLS